MTPRRAAMRRLATAATKVALLAVAAIAPSSMAAAGAPGMNCTLAHRPYSSRTPLIDLLLNPATRAIVESEFGDIFAKLPPMMRATTPPSFAAIVSARELPGFAAMVPGTATPKDADAALARLDVALRAVPLTPEAIRARCARYDETPPRLPAVIRRPAILVFGKINGYKDTPSVEAAATALKTMATRRGWTLVFGENGAVFNMRDLARFDAVIWNNVSGDVLTVPQQQAFKTYLARGGGYAGFHGSAGDPLYVWDWYPDTLIGARFDSHTMGPQFQEARVRIEDPGNAITRGLGDGWSMTEEWYSFKTNPRASGTRVLATLDESTYTPKGFGGRDLRMGDHPIAWTRCIGNGRSFYSAIGHRPESYAEPHSLRLLEQGIAWAAGQGETACVKGRDVAR